MFKTQTIIARLLDAVIMNGVPELRLPESNGSKKSIGRNVSKEPPLKTVALVFRLDPKGHNTHFEPYVLDILIFYIYSS